MLLENQPVVNSFDILHEIKWFTSGRFEFTWIGDWLKLDCSAQNLCLEWPRRLKLMGQVTLQSCTWLAFEIMV